MRGVVIMKLQRTFILTLVCLFTLGLGIVSATEPEKIYPSPVRDVMATTGEIIAVDGDKVTVKGDGNYPVATVIVTDKTLLIDGKDGDLKGDRALKKGRKVTAYYSSKMTRSYPPQAEGFAIVFGKNNEKQGKYMHVEKVTQSENGESVRLLNSNRDIIVTVSKDVYEDYQNIKEGDRIMAWYSIMTMSLPGQTNATKVIVLP
jgi:hypothetical protein